MLPKESLLVLMSGAITFLLLNFDHILCHLAPPNAPDQKRAGHTALKGNICSRLLNLDVSRLIKRTLPEHGSRKHTLSGGDAHLIKWLIHSRGCHASLLLAQPAKSAPGNDPIRYYQTCLLQRHLRAPSGKQHVRLLTDGSSVPWSGVTQVEQPRCNRG